VVFPSGSRCSGADGVRASGVTIMELLVVLTIMAALMGLGVGMYLNLGRQGVFTANVSRVLSTIQQVRNSSMSHPAALQIEAGDRLKGEPNGVRGIEFVTLFQSQCEPHPDGGDVVTRVLAGAMDRNGDLPGGSSFVPGVLGQALYLEGGGRVDCGNHPAYDATEGISIELWVHPLGDRGGVLVQRGSGVSLSLDKRADGLVPRFDLAFSAGQADASGKVSSSFTESRSFEAKGATVPLKRWSRIIATYDRSAVTIAVDTGRGPVERFRKEEHAPLAPSTEARLYLGGTEGASFHGYLDDIRIDGVLGGDLLPLPPQMSLAGPSRRIHFLRGRLHPGHHTRAETIVIHGERRKRSISVSTEGVVSKE
jgi:hypothetical protein